MTDYNDSYPTCEETYVTLRVFPGATDHATVSMRLNVPLAEVQIAKERIGVSASWFLSSEEKVDSKDLRRHIDWLLDRIEPAKQELVALRSEGVQIDISCYWLSASGHGGPTFSPEQMKRLGEFGLELWIDLYGAS